MNGNGHVRSPLSLNPYREIWSLREADIEIRLRRQRESVEILRERFENGNVVGRPPMDGIGGRRKADGPGKL